MNRRATWVLAVVLAGVVASPAAAGSRRSLVVHEWGTFTSMVGQDGASIEWRPFTQGNDLPGFVYLRTHERKVDIMGNVRMETPVLYFYADDATAVSVKVGFPAGKITEWYPHARNRQGRSIRWGRVSILPEATATFPAEGAPSHYYPARETDSAPLSVRTPAGRRQFEKFLFYRGVGSFALPLSARVDGDLVRVANSAESPIRTAVLFENRAGSIGYGVHALADGESTLARPVPGAQSLDGLARDLETLLVAEGLYAREASAMVTTWRSTWSEEGLRLLYIVPRAFTDAVLPLAIEPSPASVVRVLVGRAELLSPEAEHALRAATDAR